jgi:hypothetical protein
MFDSQCYLAALVYERDQDPDQVLREFASDLKARGYRAVGLVQLGHHCIDTPQLSAMLVHSGEELQLSAPVRPGAGWMSASCSMPARKSPARSTRALTS